MPKDPVPSQTIIDTPFDEELKTSYLSYAMSVIADRALPDARDGLKPVQRRILHAMNELGLSASGEHKKSARIVGETMGKYHPHGDSSIYDAMARMAQSFSLRVPLVSGQGNFGSLDGDPPAAMRYTEAKMAEAGELMQADIKENSVPFVPNFDESLKEPAVLPSLLPNLLINGSSGIAVGMATNIPPHNPGEVMDGLSEYLKGNCSLSVSEVASLLEGPDFPTGGEIVGNDGIGELYRQGRGRIVVRGRVNIEETQNRFFIVITEVPYGVPKERLVGEIAEEINKKNVDGIVAVRDESDREGNRVVVEMYKRADPGAVLNLLYAGTSLQTTFGGNLTALIGGAPRVMTLKDMFDAYIGHRRDVVTNRTRFRLERDKARLHIVEGLLRATDMLDEIIELIRESGSPAEAKKGLVETLGFSSLQSDAILAMRLGSLTKLERTGLEREEKELESRIARYEKILGSGRELDKVLLKEFGEVKDALVKMGGAERRTSFIEENRQAEQGTGAGNSQLSLPFGASPLVPAIVFIEGGHIKKKDVKRPPAPGGAGAYFTGETIFAVSLGGRFYSRERKGIPDADSRKLESATEFFGAEQDEKLTLISPDEHDIVFFVSPDGSVKKMTLDEMRGSGARKNTSRQIFPLGEGESLFKILPCSSGSDIVLVTANGKCLRIKEDAFRAMGPGGRGVAGISIDTAGVQDRLADAIAVKEAEGDNVSLAACTRREPSSGVTSENKIFRFELASLKTSGRGGKGIYIHRGDNPSAGEVFKIGLLRETDILVFKDGETMNVSDIPVRDISTHTLASLTELKGGVFSVRRR